MIHKQASIQADSYKTDREMNKKIGRDRERKRYEL